MFQENTQRERERVTGEAIGVDQPLSEASNPRGFSLEFYRFAFLFLIINSPSIWKKINFKKLNYLMGEEKDW